MGWFVLPEPGKKNANGEEIGPCVTECDHTDCAQTRQQASWLCKVCGKPIGYETRFYFETPVILIHASCCFQATCDYLGRPLRVGDFVTYYPDVKYGGELLGSVEKIGAKRIGVSFGDGKMRYITPSKLHKVSK